MSAEDLKLSEYSSDSWMGGIRYRFNFKGHDAWVVEPNDPAPGKAWFALPEWPTAFPERNGVKSLLSLGFYMVHVDLMGLYANPEAVGIMYDFYQWLQSRQFAAKGALIGMSLGGLYSFRFAAEHPECISCIYADAPVCDLAYSMENNDRSGRLAGVMSAYQVQSPQNLVDHPLSPVNNYLPIVNAGIPVLMILGLDDNVVNHKTNGSLLAERYTAAGGNINVIGRPSWGHHPHGLDDPDPIVRFILRGNFKIKN